MYNCDTNQDCVLVTTSLYPLANPLGQVIDHVSHGGQLGAPLSYQDCAQILADQCIRGQWQHNRHFQGPNNPADSYAIDFHTAGTHAASHPIFDTLLCACLGCCGENTKGGPTGVPPGWLHKKFQLCNPEDHRVCGPEPRPAPANALIWSGIGKLTPSTNPNGKAGRAATYAVIRVYVEDRSEPGGWHPKGSVSPADVYCFQAWDTGIPIAKKGDPNNLGTSAALGGLDVNVFRSTVSADSCAFLQGISVGGTCPPGSLPAPIVAGVCASVSDTGTLRTGNQQIHPSTGATCDTPAGIPAPTPLPVSGCVNPTRCTTDPTITPCELVTPVGP